VNQAKAQNKINIDKKPDQSLPRSKLLRGKRNYQRLFDRSSVVKKSGILCRYRIYANPKAGAKFGFIAPKKLFQHAVDRNKIKRWLRETFRINQHLLPDAINKNDIGFHSVFIVIGKNLSYSIVEQQMISILKTLSRELTSERASEVVNHHHKTD